MRSDREDNLPLAISAILFTVFALALGDAFIKQLSTDFSLFQIFVIRSAIVVCVLVVTLRRRFGSVRLKPTNPIWTWTRSMLLTFMWITYYISLPHIPLSVAAAAYYTLPLFILVFAALFAGEKVRAKGWIAVVLGFAGVVVVLRPDTEGFNIYALLPVVSAILYALAMILTRTQCRNEHPLILSGYLNITMFVVGGIGSIALTVMNPTQATIEASEFLFSAWGEMGPEQWIAMGLLSLAILIGSIGAAIAYQNGPASIIGILDFAYVGFAAIFGFLLFHEIPSISMLIGIGMIVVSGILAVRQGN